jgi:Na+-translocating ferredoxin:NAD+ oxidoreductase RnfC subunit
LAQDFPSSTDEIVARIFEAGVVGAGGAGFPTHLKASAAADIVIANGCECEPLLQSDRHVLEAFAGEVLDGLRIMMLATGAKRGSVAVREGLTETVQALRKRVDTVSGIDVFAVADNYPAGDEHILVYEVTGRAIPQGGIPPDVGVVVSNVNTLLNVRRALAGTPVTARVVSVCGDVANPSVSEVPVGISVKDLLKLTGNDSGLEEKGVLLSGVMMGTLCEDLAAPIDKRIGSVVVLPLENEVMVRKSLPVETIVKRAASVCCQCTLCTELCPRHLMGHGITPHKIMRAICWGTAFAPDLGGALFCSGCGLCGDRISFMVRAEMASLGITFERQTSSVVTPVRAHRLVPHSRIVERTGLVRYERVLPVGASVEPDRVRIPLIQHTGSAARPVISVGDAVRKGQLIGDCETGQVGAKVHASIDGVVTDINHNIVIERR